MLRTCHKKYKLLCNILILILMNIARILKNVIGNCCEKIPPGVIYRLRKISYAHFFANRKSGQERNILLKSYGVLQWKNDKWSAIVAKIHKRRKYIYIHIFMYFNNIIGGFPQVNSMYEFWFNVKPFIFKNIILIVLYIIQIIVIRKTIFSYLCDKVIFNK